MEPVERDDQRARRGDAARRPSARAPARAAGRPASSPRTTSAASGGSSTTGRLQPPVTGASIPRRRERRTSADQAERARTSASVSVHGPCGGGMRRRVAVSRRSERTSPARLARTPSSQTPETTGPWTSRSRRSAAPGVAAGTRGRATSGTRSPRATSAAGSGHRDDERGLGRKGDRGRAGAAPIEAAGRAGPAGGAGTIAVSVRTRWRATAGKRRSSATRASATTRTAVLRTVRGSSQVTEGISLPPSLGLVDERPQAAALLGGEAGLLHLEQGRHRPARRAPEERVEQVAERRLRAASRATVGT